MLLVSLLQDAPSTANLLLEEARLQAELAVLLQRRKRTEGVCDLTSSTFHISFCAALTAGVTTCDAELQTMAYQQVKGTTDFPI